MIYKDESSFARDIKEKKIYNLYLLYGSENYLINLYIDKIKKYLLPKEQESFNLNILDGKETNLQTLADTVEAMPLLTEKRIVILDNPDTNKLLMNKSFETVLSDIPSYTCLIIVFKGILIDPYKNKTYKNLFDVCDKNGAVISLVERNDNDLFKFITAKIQKKGLTISKKNAQFLIERCSNNMSKISTEISKLTSYMQQGEITRDIIIKITVPTIEAEIYDLSKAVSNGNLDFAMEIIDRLIYLRQPEVVILSSLSYYFLDLYKAKLAKDCDMTIADSAILFGYKPTDFRIKNAFRDCTKYSDKYITEIINILTHADLDLKSSKFENRTIIEKAVVEIFIAGKAQNGR